MPELAEVEYMRTQWNLGIGLTVASVSIHENNVFKSCDVDALRKLLPGCRLVSSSAAAKQMLFVFHPRISGAAAQQRKKNKSTSTGASASIGQCIYLGIHLGMTGRLLAVQGEGPGADRHESWEHLVLHMQGDSSTATLVFSDFRMFGRVLFHAGDTLPSWWTSIAPAITSSEFTRQCVAEFMKRRSGITIKAALLMQERFPGIGNWMADEILWRSCIHPSKRCGDLTDDEVADLHSVCQWVCSQAMAIIGSSFADPPPTWLYHYRWQDGGKCPLTGEMLRRETIGGRTSCFCPSRQKMKAGGKKHIFMDDANIVSHVPVKSSAWKAQAMASSTKETSPAPAVKHGKKRGASDSAQLKAEAEEESDKGVSPWGRLVRTGTSGKGARVKVEIEEKKQTLRTTGSKKMKLEEVIKIESEPLSRRKSQARRPRSPVVQPQIIALTERQQAMQVIRATRLQQQTKPRNQVQSKRVPSSKFKVKREL